MDTYEQNVFPQEPEAADIPPQEVPEVPVQEVPESPWQEIPETPHHTEPISAEPYRSSGAGRKESPFADSPYVMQYAPQVEQRAVPKKQKVRRSRRPIEWKKSLPVLLPILMLVICCSITALLVREQWEERTKELEAQFSLQLEQLQQQIDNATSSLLNPAPAVAPGETMTPSQIYANNVASVVSISANITKNMYGQSAQGVSGGSGFILTEDGYVITNAHVVEGATSITVTTYDGTKYAATATGMDSDNDIAVLKVEATGLPAVTVGSSDALVIGDMVVAIGNPFGNLNSTQTVGYISGKDREITTDGTIIRMLQTDVAINSGNSGGPLFNAKGEVVGITTAKYSGTSTSGASIEGISFSIPIDDVMGHINDIINYGYVTGAYIGVIVSNTDESAALYGLPSGAYVMSVEAGRSAERAGIQPKDIITKLGDYEVTSINSLTRALRNFKAGDTTTITLFRSGGQMELEITLDEKPREEYNPATTPDAAGAMPSEGNADEWYEYFRRYFGDVQPFSD